MSTEANIDTRARYNESHEWARPAGDGIYECGISKHAEAALGDVVFVELPAVGSRLKKGQSFGVIESVKAASDLYMPMDGVIASVNEELRKNPALVNGDCYGAGWIVTFKPDNPAQWDSLLDPSAYTALVAEA